MVIATHTLQNTFAVLPPCMDVEPLDVTPGLYERLDREFDHFAGHALLSLHAFDGDRPTWERHPAGDGIGVLLSRAASTMLQMPGGDETVVPSVPGASMIVPRGTRHTARIAAHAQMLFLTPGQGTGNRVDAGVP
jgi:hypothetical protein